MLASAGAHVVLGDVDDANLAKVVDDIAPAAVTSRRTDIRVRGYPR
jgi:hypothetical protein